jgi:hypothetical protein
MPTMAYLWVKEGDYAEFRVGTELPETYAEYLADIRELEDLARERGLTPQGFLIKPVELEAWCRNNGKVMDAKACSEYAVHRLKLLKKH